MSERARKLLQVCRRFSQYFSPEARAAFEKHFGILLPVKPLLPARYNIPPFVNVYAVLSGEGNQRPLQEVLWGLIPNQSKDFAPHPKFKMDLTRVEGLDDAGNDYRKGLLKTSRCVVPVNNYFEWKTVGKQKLPYKIQLTDSPIMALGAIFDVWLDAVGGRRYSCSIITMPASSRLAKIHPRMPFVLDFESLPFWLSADLNDLTAARELIRPLPEANLACLPVSTKVNKVENDYAEVLEPLKEHANVQGDLFT